MKPLMLIPPAQAEALYDAHPEAHASARLGDRQAPLPWLDDDAFDEEPRPSAAPLREPRQAGRSAGARPQRPALA